MFISLTTTYIFPTKLCFWKLNYEIGLAIGYFSRIFYIQNMLPKNISCSIANWYIWSGHWSQWSLIMFPNMYTRVAHMNFKQMLIINNMLCKKIQTHVIFISPILMSFFPFPAYTYIIFLSFSSLYLHNGFSFHSTRIKTSFIVTDLPLWYVLF